MMPGGCDNPGHPGPPGVSRSVPPRWWIPRPLTFHGVRSRDPPPAGRPGGVGGVGGRAAWAGRRQNAGFVKIHYTKRMPSWVCGDRGLISFAQLDRAVADTARQLTSLRDVRAVVADAVQSGRCSIGSVDRELRHGPVQRSALLRQTLAEVAAGNRSTTEGDLHDLIKRARLPVPMFNPCLYLGTEFLAVPDCWWPEAGVAGEVDSREWHLSPEGWQRTIERHARMSASGILVLHFTPSQIRNEPAKVAAIIRDALRAGCARQRLPIEARAAAA
jgi:hypothetical protein